MPSMWSFIVGPTLYGKYNSLEQPNSIMDNIGNASFALTKGIFNFSTSLAFSPFILLFFYSRGWLNPSSMTKILTNYLFYVVIAYGLRTVSRMMNPNYREFIAKYEKCQNAKDFQKLVLIYDFEMYNVKPYFTAEPNEKLWYLKHDLKEPDPVTKALAYFAFHAFGRHMIYPGSLRLLNYVLSGQLHGMRRDFMKDSKCKRIWIETSEGDRIDGVFVDGERKDDTLIITFEGNAGFYETGILVTPKRLGYSILAWNTPGFAESTGLPYPNRTMAAAEAVMQYAMNVLHYKVENIVLYGWSIGGYPASWLAANYPNVRAVFLDATFDDLLVLAQSRMPKVFGGVVEYAIRNYANLQIEKILSKYKGPLKMVRRLQEEILVTNEDVPDHVKRASNRANYLLKAVLRDRHPELIEGMEEEIDYWLELTPYQRETLDKEILMKRSPQKKRLFDACTHYFVDVDATHVFPLDAMYFEIPECFRSD